MNSKADDVSLIVLSILILIVVSLWNVRIEVLALPDHLSSPILQGAAFIVAVLGLGTGIWKLCRKETKKK